MLGFLKFCFADGILSSNCPCGKLINLQCFLGLLARAWAWAPPGRVYGWEMAAVGLSLGVQVGRPPDHPRTRLGAGPWPSPATPGFGVFWVPRSGNPGVEALPIS